MSDRFRLNFLHESTHIIDAKEMEFKDMCMVVVMIDECDLFGTSVTIFLCAFVSILQ